MATPLDSVHEKNDPVLIHLVVPYSQNRVELKWHVPANPVHGVRH